MFDEKQISALDPNYFNIILKDDYDVTIQSKCTGHVWYIHCCEYPNPASCVVFHKHKMSHPYHQHSRASSLRRAVKDIKAHDIYQLNGRKPS